MSSVEGEAWALHRGLDRVQFESHSKVLVEANHMKRRDNSEFLSIVHDIISFMSTFLNFEVKFVRRQANSVAHTLARAANSWSTFHRFENIPLCIEHLVVNEMQWRIGSGDNIRVIHDPWLSGSANRWVPSPQPAAEKILETPLVSSIREDKVVWEEERNGCYSVKSGYKLAMRHNRGCLPTRSRLLERRVECTLNCPVCDEEIEDELHIFFRCAVARDSWSAVGLSSVLHNATYQQTNAMDRIFAVCSNESSDTVGRVTMIRFKEEIDECVRRMNELRGNQDEEESMQYQELSERHATLLIQEEGGHTQEELCEVAKSYFDTLFKPRDGDHDPVLNLIHPRVTDDDNVVLTAPITKVEIQQALFQMHPDKSPGPDEFNPAFYQRFWEQCSDDIFSAASTWLERGYFPISLNETNIYLIPKCDNPTSMKDLRPISLCNVLYKMISKVLANRLKCCLDKCVSQEQSAFVEGRSILDNALIATEVIHALKRKTQGRRGELALKIDISKAYDKVDWGFFRGVMTKMGFSDVWIRWVMMCVSSVNYSVLMNSDRVGPISPGRECLTALIHQAVGRGDLHGVRICRSAPEVSHLLFTDDCFLFCRANVAEAAKEDLSHILGVKLVLGTGIYLGLPPMRSMWQARQILSLGCRWRIGSGDNIRVMHDPWLSGSANRWVPSPQPAAEKILETPLVSSVREDKVVWEEERNGCYSVKSGYKLAMRDIIGSDNYHVVGNWNGIWKAQAPHKARHLLWRLCRGCLPTRSRLLERRVECTLNCPVCDEEIEDELHIFFRCAVARDSWSAAGLSSVLHNATYQQTNAMDRIFAVCSNESSDTVDLVRWEKPALDWVKCNVDAAFVAGSGRTSVGLCFCDNSGHFMAGLTQWQQTVISSVEGEAWALLLAMEEARHRGLDRVQFESDSKVLIEAIHMQRRGNSEFLSIVHDILSLMSSFINFEVKFVRRQANLVAHTLARAANSWASFHRFENIPFCIEHLIFNEMK
ncbi:hypothetical protein TSUD_400890 [Trifolium subterraneum]|uniref:Reverse transcriptase domain-containing protein n=1 Tax=Trifolium subterraneum TaxID=3900 RepID=A0A2Z6P9M7_TRISU|nr:hypothetical protein TSUD_400890 [Trifolium subterraneum]